MQAEEIFEAMDTVTIYYVSDNTGDTNGGSADLRKKYPKGRSIKYTLYNNQICTADSFNETARVDTYFIGGKSCVI